MTDATKPKVEFFKEEDCDIDFNYLSHTGTVARIASGKTKCISLKKANSLLRERGTPLFGLYKTPQEFEMHSEPYNWNTHRCLVINIEPICEDTAEAVLKDFVIALDAIQEQNDLRELVDRAKKLTKS